MSRSKRDSATQPAADADADGAVGAGAPDTSAPDQAAEATRASADLGGLDGGADAVTPGAPADSLDADAAPAVAAAPAGAGADRGAEASAPAADLIADSALEGRLDEISRHLRTRPRFESVGFVIDDDGSYADVVADADADADTDADTDGDFTDGDFTDGDFTDGGLDEGLDDIPPFEPAGAVTDPNDDAPPIELHDRGRSDRGDSPGFDAADASEGPPSRGGFDQGDERWLRTTRPDRPVRATAETTPPSDLTAERGVLSSVLIDGRSLAFVLDFLRAEDFYDPRHRHLFAAMKTLALESAPIDPITVQAGLEAAGASEKAGGYEYLVDLCDFAGSSLSIEHYGQIVSKLARVRSLLGVTHKVQALGYGGGLDPDGFVDLVQKALTEALQATVGGRATPLADVVGGVYEEILRTRARGGEVVGLPTGFRDLDKLILGLHPSDLFILAARPAMGKTALALNLALNVALRGPPDHKDAKFRVLVFSMEMSRQQLVQRLLSTRSRVGLTQIRKGQISVEEEVQLREATAELSELSLFIDDTPRLSPVEVHARAKQIFLNGGLDLIVIDYLQLMRGTGGTQQSREQEISEISRSLKALAKELEVTVLALSQLNRGVESRADKRPMMSDLRESGAIEQDADIIAFIYRDHVYNKNASEHHAELIISKQRAGPTGTVELNFEGRLTRFTTLDDRMNDQWAGIEPTGGFS